MEEALEIGNLESYLNVVNFLIDNIMREAKMNDSNNLIANKKLQKLSKYRTSIMKLIENKLDETFG